MNKKKKAPKPGITITFRMSTATLQNLKRWAEQNDRTVSGQVSHVLRKAMTKELKMEKEVLEGNNE